MAASRSTQRQTDDVAPRRKNQGGEETRQRIIDAALATVRDEGLMGTSARAIARTGDFNQALVFYHFGSVEELLLAALQRAHERRTARFQPRLEEVTDLAGLVEVAVDLHGQVDDPDTPALAAIVAGWSTTSELGPKVLATLKPWDEMVAGALTRALDGSPFAPFVPTEQLAHALSALFLGIEMFSRLDPDDSTTIELFASLSALANLAGPMLNALPGDSAD